MQLRSTNIVPIVAAALADSGLPPERLELEITETVLLQDSEATLATLHQLRDLGARISMDDFGTGYSSLSYLRRFPFDKIKIDRSFVQRHGDARDSIAHRPRRRRARQEPWHDDDRGGRGNRGQLERARSEGCTEVQGYFFGPPRPASRGRAASRRAAPQRPSGRVETGGPSGFPTREIGGETPC